MDLEVVGIIPGADTRKEAAKMYYRILGLGHLVN